MLLIDPIACILGYWVMYQRLRRWLGFMLGAQVVLVLTALGSFVFPELGNFVNSALFTDHPDHCESGLVPFTGRRFETAAR